MKYGLLLEDDVHSFTPPSQQSSITHIKWAASLDTTSPLSQPNNHNLFKKLIFPGLQTNKISPPKIKIKEPQSLIVIQNDIKSISKALNERTKSFSLEFIKKTLALECEFEESLLLAKKIDKELEVEIEKAKLKFTEEQNRIAAQKQKEIMELQMEKEKKEREQKEAVDRGESERRKFEEGKRLATEKVELEKRLLVESKLNTERNYCSAAALDDSKRHIDIYKNINDIKIPQWKQNSNLKKTFFKLKLDINTRIGQVQSSYRKINEIVHVISKTLQTGKTHSPDLHEWLLHFTADCIVSQSEKEVSVNKPLAFPLALIAVSLYKQIPEFLSILLGAIFTNCAYCIPRYSKKKENETARDFKIRVGYKEKDEGVLETDIQNTERMVGVFTVYCAILQTEIGPNNLHGMDFAWKWMARVLNMDCRLITPHLILTFLEVCGPEYLQTFKNQAKKTVDFLIKVYFDKIPQNAVAVKTRLELFIEENYRNGMISEMKNKRMDP